MFSFANLLSARQTPLNPLGSIFTDDVQSTSTHGRVGKGRQDFVRDNADTYAGEASGELWCWSDYLTMVDDSAIRRKTRSMQSELQQIKVRFKHLSLMAALGSTKEDSDSNNIVKKMLGTKHSVRKHILHDISGSFRPGVVTLLLGQSGSGKSAFMKLLSGRFPMHHEITVEGTVSYNGVPHKKLLKRLPQFVNYVTQTETHLPTLTVRETLEFAHKCCGSPAENVVHGGSAEVHYPDVVLRTLGLDNCQHTIVGNGMHRGISGGEKRRVTTGEMEFGMKYVTLLDEISTGLDSAAAFDIVAAQRKLAKQMNKTVVISLLQPSPEIFALFDDVLVLNEGRSIYHGSTREVEGYFESLGFVCPPERDLADFLCDLATPQQAQYEVGVLVIGGQSQASRSSSVWSSAGYSARRNYSRT